MCQLLIYCPDRHNRNWAHNNYLSAHVLAEAEKVRHLLEHILERFKIPILSIADEKRRNANIKKALCCGFFMQVAHKENKTGNYLTIKDSQVCCMTLMFDPG